MATANPNLVRLCPAPFAKIADTARETMDYLTETFKDDETKYLGAIEENCNIIVERWEFVRRSINQLAVSSDWGYDSPEEVLMRDLEAAVDYIRLFVEHRLRPGRFQIEDLHSLHSGLGRIVHLIDV
jgi:hypothetical protein